MWDIYSEDAIVNEYRLLAEEEGIRYNWKGVIPSQIVVSDYEMCVLFSNAIKNALEAALRTESEKKFINIELTSFEKHIEIKVENTTNGELDIGADGTLISTKNDSDNHGQGFASMKEIADRYNGEINYNLKSGCFTLEITI